MYEDRTAAGRILAEQLLDNDVRPDVVLAASTGGLHVAEPVCERFDADRGLMVSEPIRTAATKQLPIGAVTDTGVAWVDHELVESFAMDEEKLEVEKQRAFREARDKHQLYEDVVDDPTPAGTVAIVDEGLTNSVTLRACAWAMAQVDAAYSVLAAPVGTPDDVAAMHTLADEVVVDERAPGSRLLDDLYETFETPGFRQRVTE